MVFRYALTWAGQAPDEAFKRDLTHAEMDALVALMRNRAIPIRMCRRSFRRPVGPFVLHPDSPEMKLPLRPAIHLRSMSCTRSRRRAAFGILDVPKAPSDYVTSHHAGRRRRPVLSWRRSTSAFRKGRGGSSPTADARGVRALMDKLARERLHEVTILDEGFNVWNVTVVSRGPSALPPARLIPVQVSHSASIRSSSWSCRGSSLKVPGVVQRGGRDCSGHHGQRRETNRARGCGDFWLNTRPARDRHERREIHLDLSRVSPAARRCSIAWALCGSESAGGRRASR